MKKTTFKSKSESDSRKIAHFLAKQLTDVNVLCLNGELGVGKTFLTKEIAKDLGINKRIISPTFVLVRSYDLTKKKLFHIDAYRMNDDSNMGELKEILNSDNATIIIEWAERIKSILPKKRIDVNITLEDDERNIEVIRY